MEMESPGEYLKREREMRGVALKDIANATKIRPGLLSALEKNDFNAMPAAPFVKGFIQAYSKYLGIDVQDALLRYESYMRSLAEGEVTAPQETAAKPAFISQFPPSITAIVIAVTLMLIASGIYIIVPKKETAESVNSLLLSEQIENKDGAEVEKVKWNAKEKFSILIGNAGGANVVFNGKPLGSLGGEGKVAKLILPYEKAGEGPVI